MADYNALFRQPNAGQAFSDAFQGAQQMRQQQALIAEQRQRQMAEDQRRAMDAHKESIVAAGQIIRNIKQRNPQMPDEQVYAMARQTAIQLGLPGADHAPSTFNPEYYSGLISAADTFAPPQQGPQDPSSVREFEYAKRNGFGGSYIDFVQTLHPPSAVTVPYGATVSAPGQAGGGNMPRVTDQASYDAIPAGGQYMDPSGQVRTKGGQAGQSSPGGFL